MRRNSKESRMLVAAAIGAGLLVVGAVEQVIFRADKVSENQGPISPPKISRSSLKLGVEPLEQIIFPSPTGKPKYMIRQELSR